MRLSRNDHRRRISPRSRKFVVGVLSAICLWAWLAPDAAAEFGPIELVSKSSKEQAEFAREPAISADGNYVAFDGELGGRTGIFRKDLSTGALTLVVPGAAEAPSISAEGRFVSFTTTQSLDSTADPAAGTQDVYVADLATSPSTYELVSATGSGSERQRMSGSSSAAPRVAMSADGSEVAFVNGSQVYVYTRGAEEPTLITVKRGAITPEPVPDGGAFQNAGAALSADGNAVAWVGDHLPEQVPLLPTEEQAIRAIEERRFGTEFNRVEKYFEPLWRLLPSSGQNDSAADPTRRIIGGNDPLAPGCGDNAAEPACRGPFPDLAEDHQGPDSRANLPGPEGIGWGINLPQLSADGQAVAVIGSPEEDNDLFVVSMVPGLSRIEAVRQLTRWTNPVPGKPAEELFGIPKDLALLGPIQQCTISPDGEHIAFTTERQNFPLNPPTLITPRPTALPTVVELYQVNLEGETIERVTPGTGTGVSVARSIETGTIREARYGEAELGASGPSYGAGGRLLAFASGAYNLVAGDANQESDVFTVESKPPSPIQPSTISSRPSSLSVHVSWRLTVHAISRPDGAVRIVAGVPGTGTLSAQAKSKVGSKPAPQKVSAGHRRARVAGIVRLELNLPQKLRGLAHRKGGLYSALDVQFTGPGGKPLKQQLVARFRVHAKSSAKTGR